jgi:hypothetical protein
MTWEAKPTGRRGRQPGYSDAAIQTCRAVDSTGITVEGEGEWNACKHVGTKRPT